MMSRLTKVHSGRWEAWDGLTYLGTLTHTEAGWVIRTAGGRWDINPHATRRAALAHLRAYTVHPKEQP